MFLNAFRGRKLGFSVVRITLKWHNERDLFVSEDTLFGLLTVLTRRDGEWDTWNSNIPRSVLFLPSVCARCSLSFVAMTPGLLTGCLHKLVPWTGRTTKKQFRRYSAGAGHSWSFCQAIRIWISTWPPPSNHPPKGICSSGACGWASKDVKNALRAQCTSNKMQVWVLSFATLICASVRNLIEKPELFFSVPMENWSNLALQGTTEAVQGGAPGEHRQTSDSNRKKKERNAPQWRLSGETNQVSRAFTTVSPRSAAQTRARAPVLEAVAWKAVQVFSGKTGQAIEAFTMVTTVKHAAQAGEGRG